MWKKMSVIFDTFRPTVWPRIAAEMTFGFAAANNFSLPHFTRLLVGFIAAGPLLWSAAYMLNDLTDIDVDKQHGLKSKKAITRGLIPKQASVVIMIVLTFMAFLLGQTVGSLFSLGLTSLMISQFFYTVPPIRCKERAGVDILLNSINAALRFLLGFIAGAGDFLYFPLFFFLFAVGFKTTLFIGHRLQSRELEVKNKYHSTVALLSKPQIYVLLGVSTGITCLGYLLAVFIDNLGWELVLSGFIFFLLLIPFYQHTKTGYLDEAEHDLGMRNYLYIAIFIFAVSLLLLRMW